jgi:hypothetical protein
MCWLFLCILNRRQSWNIAKVEQESKNQNFKSCFNSKNGENEVKLKGFRRIDHNLSLHHNNAAVSIENQQAARLANHNVLVY